jgi:ABC-2 type transport system permease protein
MNWLDYLWAQIRLSQRVFWKRIGFALSGTVLPLGLGILVSLNARGYRPMDGTRPELFVLTGFIAFGAFFIVYTLINAVTARRDALIYKRLRGTPLPPSAIFAGEALSAATVSWAVTVALTVFGIAVLGSGAPRNVPLLVLGVLCGTVMFTLLAVGVSGILPSAETSIWIVTPVMVLFLMTSGVFLPLSTLPQALRVVGQYLPMAPLVEVVRTAYLGRDFATGSALAHAAPQVGTLAAFRACAAPLGILLAWAVLGLGLAQKFFRWDPARGG